MRTPITLKIKFKSSNLDQFIERYSVDVSRGGIFIRTKEPLPVGTQLRFEFQLQDASALIAGDGTVVWIREHDPARQGVAPGMGVRFDKLAAESQKVLDRILSEKNKRGDAQLESRFDAGVRASASASGTLSSSARVAGHNDFSGGDSRTQTPLPGAVPGLATPDDEFGNESTRVMQNELVESLTAKTRDQEDLANAFNEPEPTRKASVEELTAAVQGTRAEPKKEEAKVEVAPEVKAEAKKEEPKVEAKKEEPKVEAKKEEAKAEAKKEEPKAEAKKEEPKAEKKAEAKKDDKAEKKAEAKKDDKAEKKAEAKKDDKAVKPAKDGKGATAIPTEKMDPLPPVAAARKRSMAPIYLGLALVAAVGGYTVFRNKGGDEQPATPATHEEPAQPAAAAPAQPAPTEAPKPTENPTPTAASGEKMAATESGAAAKAAEPAAEKPAGLTVPLVSEPAGATVTVDGKPLPEPTPTTLSGLDAKKVYDVRVALKGFHEWKVKLKPKAGDKIDAALVPNEKIVEVATTPPGALVVFDGKTLGRTPFTVHKLDLSKAHTIEVKRAGFVAQTRSISATDTFESKGDKDVLALAMTLEAAPKPAAVEKPAAPHPVARKPAAKKPAPAEATTEKPAEAAATPAEKPAATAEKPAPTEKPAATEKPATAEKPAADKPAAEKPAEDKPAAEKPAGDKAGIKVPSWMKQKPADGTTPPPASDTPQQ